jgi:hypothetical protein
MARKAQPYGGLPRRHVRRIITYLDYLDDTRPCWDRLPPRLRPLSSSEIAATFSGLGRLAHVPEENRAEVRSTLSRNTAEAIRTLHSDDAEAIRALLRNIASSDYSKPGTDPNTWAPLIRGEAIKILKRRRREGDHLPLSIEEAVKILEPPPFSSEEEAEIQKQQRHRAADGAWTSLVFNDPHTAAEQLADAGINDKYMIEALKAGLKVLRKKRLGRLWDLNPHRSFAAIGIISRKRGGR